MKKRIISILLVAVMVVAMIPVVALPSAAADEAESTTASKVPYSASTPVFDGKNTGVEYEDALKVNLTHGLTTDTGSWLYRAADENDVAYVKYTNEAIYVFVTGDKGTTNESYDMTGIGFKIGTSYVGSKIVQNDYFASTLVTTGDVTITNDSNYFAYYYNQAEGALNLEVKFPVANMTAADQEAYKNGTLEIALGFMNMDNYKALASYPITSYGDFLSVDAVTSNVIPNLNSYTLGENGIEIAYDPISPTHDGRNYANEYDGATRVQLSYASTQWWGTQSRYPDANDFALVKYTNEAIYVYIQGDEGATSSWDMTGIGFRIGTSFVGTNTIQAADSLDVYLYSLGDVTVDKSFFKFNSFDVEVRFPVEKMTAADQEAYKNGTLSVELGFMNMDAYCAAATFPIGAYGAFTSQSSAETYVLPYLSTFKMAEKNYVGVDLNESAITLDGLNTDGEYDNATKLNLTSLNPAGSGSWWYRDSNADDIAYVTYNNEAIYVYVQGNKGTSNETYDITAMAFKIGSSYVGSNTIQNGSNGGFLLTSGSVAVTNSFFGFSKGGDDNLLCMEARFPVASMSVADQEAFRNGTLSIELGFMNLDNYKAVATFPVISYGSFVNGIDTLNSQVLPYLTTFKLERETEITYVDAPLTLDGEKTEGEYDGAIVVPMAYHTGDGGWLDKTPAVNDLAFIAYSYDAIYVYVNADCGELGIWDMTAIGFKIGNSYVGSNAAQHNDPGAYLYSLGESTVDVSFFAVDDAVNLEARFPVAGLTAEDKEAFKNGTLEIGFAFMNMDYYSWTASFPTGGSYSTFTSQSSAETHVLPYLETFTLGEADITDEFIGANVTLGQNINVSYYAVLSDAANATVNFTYNENEYAGAILEPADGVFTYKCTFLGLAPQCMGDNIAAELVVGGETVDAKAEYSVLQNCQNLLGRDTTSATAKQLIYDLLAYGAAAQNYANYKTDALVNAGYEALATEYAETPLAYKGNATLDGLNTNGEYDNAYAFAINKLLPGTQNVGGGSTGSAGYDVTSTVDVPAGSYYKVIFADDAIYVFVNIADTTPAYYSSVYSYSDSVDLYFNIGESFKGYEHAFRHGTMGATNNGVGTLSSWPGKQVDNADAGWSYEIKLPVSGMTEEDQAKYASGTLDVAISVRIADRGNSDTAWGFTNGVVYADSENATNFRTDTTGYAVISATPATDKAVTAPTVEGAKFAAAGVYHGNANKAYAKVSVAAGVDVSTLTVTIDGVEATLEQYGDAYIVFTDDVKVTDFDKVFTFVLSDGVNTQTFEYSINSYAIIKAVSGKTDKTVELAKALYNYGLSAEAYIAG